jgi:hypothetical protein
MTASKAFDPGIRSTMKIETSNREIASLLAGLRLLQQLREREIGSEVRDIATDGDEFERLNDDEIDDLAERINLHATQRGG